MFMLLLSIGMMILSYVIQARMAKKNKPKPAALEDWDFPQKDEGTKQAVIFGDCWQDGPSVMYTGNYRTKKIKAGGKKG